MKPSIRTLLALTAASTLTILSACSHDSANRRNDQAPGSVPASTDSSMGSSSAVTQPDPSYNDINSGSAQNPNDLPSRSDMPGTVGDQSASVGSTDQPNDYEVGASNEQAAGTQGYESTENSASKDEAIASGNHDSLSSGSQSDDSSMAGTEGKESSKAHRKHKKSRKSQKHMTDSTSTESNDSNANSTTSGSSSGAGMTGSGSGTESSTTH